MPKVALVGAGSVEFTKTLVGDLLAFPELHGRLELALHDVDSRRLTAARALADYCNRARGAGARVTETLERRRALEDADYVLFTVQVGGHDATVRDFEIPMRHGIRSTIGDTVGIGGVFRALRTLPVICETARDIADVAPDALLLNYANPMAMLCWGAYESAPIRVVGLCHSVQRTARKLEQILGLEPASLRYRAAGVNHLAFFLELEDGDGEPLAARLRAAVAADPDGLGRTVRAELFRRLDYFVTESSEHAAEYVPWFLAHQNAIDHYRIPIGEYVRRSEENLGAFERTEAALAQEESIPVDVSDEFAPAIVRAIETGNEFRFNGNVRNDALISNLPAGACVEVPCVADGAGVRADAVGELPPELAALDRAYLEVCELTVRAYLEGRRELAYMACALDPGVEGQGVPFARVRAACDELFAAHDELLRT